MLDCGSISGGSGKKFAGSGTRVIPVLESHRGKSSDKAYEEQSMPLNSYLTLGRSGLRVSPFCLVDRPLGKTGAGEQRRKTPQRFFTFLERGGNFVDTANFY